VRNPGRLFFLTPVFATLLLMPRAAALGGEPPALALWPEGVPGLKPNAPAEIIASGRATRIHHPYVAEFAPAKPVGTAMIICPGGGYTYLAIDNNGSDIAHWLNSLGITAFVLHYRLQEYGQPAALRDVLRAVRLVRSRAREFGVRPDRVGVFGASAGGHLAACAATLFADPAGRTGAALDAVSARPDFVALLYPLITMRDPYTHAGSRAALLGSSPSAELIDRFSAELHVTAHTRPIFIAQTEEDRSVPVENSLMFYQALHAAGVPAEMHVWAKGHHGFSLDPSVGPAATWPRRCAEWLEANGWLGAPPR
jgi:acetyl esterase/lipase